VQGKYFQLRNSNKSTNCVASTGLGVASLFIRE
jgi:hypothetical protein